MNNGQEVAEGSVTVPLRHDKSVIVTRDLNRGQRTEKLASECARCGMACLIHVYFGNILPFMI